MNFVAVDQASASPNRKPKTEQLRVSAPLNHSA